MRELRSRSDPRYRVASPLCSCGRCSAAASAKQLLASGHVDEAVQMLANSRSSDLQATPMPTICSAARYFMMEEWDRGIAACEHAVNLDPQKSLYYLWLGRVYGEKADQRGISLRRWVGEEGRVLRLSALLNLIRKIGKRAPISLNSIWKPRASWAAAKIKRGSRPTPLWRSIRRGHWLLGTNRREKQRLGCRRTRISRRDRSQPFRRARLARLRQLLSPCQPAR